MSVILTCNPGSSNTKLAAFDTLTLERKAHTVTHGMAETLEWICSVGSLDICAVGYRVAHGGPGLTEPTRITPEVMRTIGQLASLAPLHQPAVIRLITEVQKFYPGIPHIACFDTAFHQTLPEVERRLPIPEWYHKEGVRRYGFHGLSYQHIADVLPQYMGAGSRGAVVVAHLGNGSSVCAMKNRQSMATSMGFSALDGLMMGTRSGAIDPGLILYMLNDLEMKPNEVHHLLYLESGLLGVSGKSADMRELLASDTPAAREAIALYCYLAAKQIAGLLPAIDGLDALVFTGGIGENNPEIRDAIIARLRWLGNFPVYTIPANEELVIAKACCENIFLDECHAVPS